MRIEGEASGAEIVLVKEVAKWLRLARRVAFPAVQFQGQSRRYAGGASIVGRYVRAPERVTVELVHDLLRSLVLLGAQYIQAYSEEVA